MPICERSKKLMMLGAGPFQMPGIRKAVALGHYVISVDDRPENIGHKFSHQYLNCSTIEREELAASRRGDGYRWHLHLQFRCGGAVGRLRLRSSGLAWGVFGDGATDVYQASLSGGPASGGPTTS